MTNRKQRLELIWVRRHQTWQYLLIPDDQITDSTTIDGLVAKFATAKDGRRTHNGKIAPRRFR